MVLLTNPMRHFLRKWRRRIFSKRVFLWLGGLFALGVIAVGVFIAYTLSTLPSLDLLSNHQTNESSKIYDRTDTKLLYELYGEEKRTSIPFEKIPEKIKQATIAIEDDGFYNHSAVDFKALLRALWTNVTSGRIVQGGSTITQQLAKKAFLTDDQTVTRKIKEVLISYQLERKFTKDEILTLYLNQIPYGSNAYGIESASQTFFQKSASDLTLAQAALLAGLPQAPSYYSPYGNHVKELLQRKDLVLKRMEELGYITKAEHEEAGKEKLVFGQIKNLTQAPHFVLEVREYLNEKYGEDFVRRSGLKITTTLDTNLQDIAERAVEAGAKRNEELYKGTNAALMAQDARTGQILAMVGSRNFFDTAIDGQYNVATQGLRQPGSALKPFAYLTALKMGYPPQTVLFDVPTEFDTTGDPAKSYKPGDYSDFSKGPIDLRTSLAQSVNITAVKTLYLIGIDNLLKTLKDFGVTTLTDPRRYGLSLVLGGGEVHLNELVGAYAVLAQEGVKHKQQMILKIEDRKGKILEQYKDDTMPVIDPEFPRQINDMLADQKARAPLYSSSLGLTVYPGYDVALKTGTTNDYRDAWAMSYTPSFVAGVWAGNNDNTPMEKRGGSILAAVPIMNAFMKEALLTMTPEAFPEPDPVYSDRPMLNGTSPELHDILYYVNKSDPTGPAPTEPSRDPQFNNWENGVAIWALNNQFVPSTGVTPEIITIQSPANASYIAGSVININVDVSSLNDLSKFEVFFNGNLIDSKSGIPASFNYTNAFAPTAFNAQNSLRFVTTDTTGISISKEIILYH